MPELKPEPIGWMTEGGKKLDDKPIQWRVFIGSEEHMVWKTGSVFTVDAGRKEYKSLDDAVASLQLKAS